MYYVYLYLREDRTPYYVGKGIGRRAYNPHIRGGGDLCPKDKDKIVIVKNFEKEKDAYEFEKWLIAVYGRKCEGGILINIQDGGLGGSSLPLDPEVRSNHQREYMREYNKKYYHANPERVKAWRDKRVEERRETERAWRAKNRDRINQRKRDLYHQKKNLKMRIDSTLEACYDRQNYTVTN